MKIRRDNKNVVTLTFSRSELLYDVKNYAYIEGDIKKVEEEHSRHQLMDIGEDGNIDRVTRVLNLVFAHCVEMCYPYSKVPVSEKDGTYEMTTDDALKEKEEYIMQLSLPDMASQTSVTLLVNLIHEYLVCKVLADWMTLTDNDGSGARKAAHWEQKAEDARSSVVGTLNARCRRTRRTLSPF